MSSQPLSPPVSRPSLEELASCESLREAIDRGLVGFLPERLKKANVDDPAYAAQFLGYLRTKEVERRESLAIYPIGTEVGGGGST